MRGRTLNDSFIVLDEAQNTTPEQMKMFLTRMGFGSKAVVTGDVTQTDLPRGQKSGLRDALELVEGIRGIGRVQFSDQDVVRHPLVAALVRAYDRRDRARFEAREGMTGDARDGASASGGEGGSGSAGEGGSGSASEGGSGSTRDGVSGAGESGSRGVSPSGGIPEGVREPGAGTAGEGGPDGGGAPGGAIGRGPAGESPADHRKG